MDDSATCTRTDDAYNRYDIIDSSTILPTPADSVQKAYRCKDQPETVRPTYKLVGYFYPGECASIETGEVYTAGPFECTTETDTCTTEPVADCNNANTMRGYRKVVIPTL